MPHAAPPAADARNAPAAPVPVVIHGARGRMGQRLVALAQADQALAFGGGFDLDRPLTAEALQEAADGRMPPVVIDFSSAAALPGVLQACRAASAPLVLGSTGLGAAHQQALDDAADVVPVLQAANFSLVVNVLHHLAAQAVQLLGPGWDLEVLEAHHRHKVDAPSGTALALAHTLAHAAGRDPSCILTERSGHEAKRHPQDITVQTLRIGDHPGEHTIHLAAAGERMELRHIATSRDSYALGALRAAAWLAHQPAGRHTMRDVLGVGEA